MQYVCYLLNHMADKTLGDIPPLQVLTGITQDISVLMRFHFYEKVYYAVDDTSFPSDTGESVGRFVGIAESVGNAMTYNILTADTNKILSRSSVRSAARDPSPTRRQNETCGTKTTWKTSQK
jgi:hypothetical protein